MKTTHCPICEANAGAGAELPETPEDPRRYVELDVGCTETLDGYLCDECAAQWPAPAGIGENYRI